MRRRSTLALAALATSAVLQTLPSLAAGPAELQPLLSQSPLAADQIISLRSERMVGITWSAGTPTVRLRWHIGTGWTAWTEAEDDSADSPEGTPGTAPQWRPAGADRVQIRTAGRVQGLGLTRVTDGTPRRTWGNAAHAATPGSSRTTASRTTAGRTTAGRTTAGRDLLGAVHSRADWGADESLRRRGPSYSGRVSAVVVHHTVNANGYQPQEVPALIRADYAYHVQSRGWADLGYNLLVDQYGGIWEGRAGGLGRATVGTHAQGFNTGTLGVAMIGDLTKTALSHNAEKAFARVFAYAARTWGFDPSGSVALTSQGSARYPSGRRVTLPRIFGHGETGITACPASVQDRLPYLRGLTKVAMGPAPKIGQPVVKGTPVHAPSPLVLDAKLSLPATWTVDVVDPQGTRVATERKTGSRPHLSWDGFVNGLPALPGAYTWAISADDGFHDVVTHKGTFEVGLPLL